MSRAIRDMIGEAADAKQPRHSTTTNVLPDDVWASCICGWISRPDTTDRPLAIRLATIGANKHTLEHQS